MYLQDAAEIITLRAIALKPIFAISRLLAFCCRDHNATSYSTETRRVGALIVSASGAEIITLRAIALKLYKGVSDGVRVKKAEIITLRAIALKPFGSPPQQVVSLCRDHNATSYSTETRGASGYLMCFFSRDHNATSYSTETTPAQRRSPSVRSRDHNATSYSTETLHRKPWYGRALCRDHNATSYSTETLNSSAR